MPKLSRVVARNSGRLLLTVADIATVLAPVSADWNGSHIFNDYVTILKHWLPGW